MSEKAMPSADIYDAKLLIIEDSEFNLKLLEHTLHELGFTQLLSARNGEEGLKITRYERPDIVVLDLLMPVMDGFSYCQAVRELEVFHDLPIIVQSALDEKHHIIKAFEAGASDYIGKPIHAEELVARICVHLEHRMMIRKLRRFESRLKQDLNHARQMQKLLIPSNSQLEYCTAKLGVETAHVYIPSEELGGDIWGLLPIDNHQLAFYIVDFAGHGLTAAMNTFRFHTLIQERQDVADVQAVMRTLNQALCNILPTGQFATATYGVLNRNSGRITYATAGSTAPFLLHKTDKTLSVLQHGGLPLGIKADYEYTMYQCELDAKSAFILYSDVLLETKDNKGQFVTRQFYESALQSMLTSSSQKIVDTLLDALKVTNTRDRFSDDVTIVAMQLLNIPG